MLFNSHIFIFAFLPISLVLYYAIGKKSQNASIWYLAIISFFFYAYSGLKFLPLLLFSITINYIVGNYIIRTKNIFALIFGLIFNLSLIIFYKYLQFIVDNLNVALDFLNLKKLYSSEVVLPIGISFFTFTQSAYLYDCFKGKVLGSKSIAHFSLFVNFFPHLIAGPLLHHKDMMPQFHKSILFDQDKFKYGIFLFIVGLSKKILLADPIAVYANALFDGIKMGLVPNFLDSLIGTVAFTFQLYFDFSGYSDMAVGIGLMFGILLPFNFDSPLRARSYIEFWQRWHISLTKYISEYIYIPLSMKINRSIDCESDFASLMFFVMAPTIFTFIIIGIWHGANWNFIIFGISCGFFICLNHLYRFFKKKYHLNLWLPNWTITFSVIVFNFILFRVDSLKSFYKILAGFINLSCPNLCSEIVLKNNFEAITLCILFLVSYVLIMYLPSSKAIYLQKRHVSNKFHIYFMREDNEVIGLILGFLFVSSVLGINEISPFLYFQF